MGDVCACPSGVEITDRDADGKPVGIRCPGCGQNWKGSVEFIRLCISIKLYNIAPSGDF